MNIFWLDDDIETCARYHFNSHCVKMVSEYTQMLSTCYRIQHGHKGKLIHAKKGLIDYPYVLDGEDGKEPIIPLATHNNHPQNIWVRKNRANCQTMLDLALALEEEYFYRYGSRKKVPHRHTYKPLLDGILSTAPDALPAGNLNRPPQTMGDEYKMTDVVSGYRNFIANGKPEKLHVWKHREVPEWLADYKK